jgi:hypothetical protein
MFSWVDELFKLELRSTFAWIAAIPNRLWDGNGDMVEIRRRWRNTRQGRRRYFHDWVGEQGILAAEDFGRDDTVNE